MTRSMHILQASQLKTSSLTADFPPSFTSRSIYKFINLHQPRLVKKKKKRSTKSVLAQIHFTYLSIPEIPTLGQNSLLCPTHPVKRKTKVKGKFKDLNLILVTVLFPPTIKKKRGNHIPTQLKRRSHEPKPSIFTSSSHPGKLRDGYFFFFFFKNPKRHAQVLLITGKTEISNQFARIHTVSQ